MRLPPSALSCAIAASAWTAWSRPDAPARWHDALGPVLAALAFVAGAASAARNDRLAALVVPAGTAIAVIGTSPASWGRGPLAPPVGYANANAELLLCACAALLLAARDLKAPRAGAFVLGAVVLGVLCALVGAMAATACSIGLLAWFVSRRHGAERLWVIGSGSLLLGAIGLTVLIGLGAGLLPSFLDSALTPERARLWGEALDLANEHPLTGVGAGNFARLAPTAADPDLAWAHSAPLQAAAEQGYVGLALILVLMSSCLVLTGRNAPVAAFVLLPCTVDYVLDFLWVVAALGFVLGVASRSPTSADTGKPWLTPPSP